MKIKSKGTKGLYYLDPVGYNLMRNGDSGGWLQVDQNHRKFVPIIPKIKEILSMSHRDEDGGYALF